MPFKEFCYRRKIKKWRPTWGRQEKGWRNGKGLGRLSPPVRFPFLISNWCAYKIQINFVIRRHIYISVSRCLVYVSFGLFVSWLTANGVRGVRKAGGNRKRSEKLPRRHNGNVRGAKWRIWMESYVKCHTDLLDCMTHSHTLNGNSRSGDLPCIREVLSSSVSHFVSHSVSQLVRLSMGQTFC